MSRIIPPKIQPEACATAPGANASAKVLDRTIASVTVARFLLPTGARSYDELGTQSCRPVSSASLSSHRQPTQP